MQRLEWRSVHTSRRFGKAEVAVFTYVKQYSILAAIICMRRPQQRLVNSANVHAILFTDELSS